MIKQSLLAAGKKDAERKALDKEEKDLVDEVDKLNKDIFFNTWEHQKLVDKKKDPQLVKKAKAAAQAASQAAC